MLPKYLKYSHERSRPFHDLLARVEKDNARLIVDLGCGPGNLTRTLIDRWQKATILGIDNSPEMLEQAKPMTNPAHLAIEETKADPRWSPVLDGVGLHQQSVMTMAWYVELLHDLGFTVDAWQTTYIHVLTGENPVLDWFKGTALRPLLKKLDPRQKYEFLDALGERLRIA